MWALALLVVVQAVTGRLEVRLDFDLDLVQAVEMEDLVVLETVVAVVLVADLLELMQEPHLLHLEVLPQEQVVSSSLQVQMK